MTVKLIEVNEKKWNAFRKYCVNNDTTMRAEMDRMLNRFVRGEKE